MLRDTEWEQDEINCVIKRLMACIVQLTSCSRQHNNLLLSIIGLHVSTGHSVIFRSLICYKFQRAVHTFGIPIVLTLKLQCKQNFGIPIVLT